MTTTTAGPRTWQDLQTIPDDAYRYELMDGALLVSPAPGLAHQLAVTAVYDVLRAACPVGLVVGVAPYDFTPHDQTSLRPDVFVARRADLGPQRSTVPPLLVVEVVSPSSRLTDRGSKRLAYEDFGVPAYWVVDPALGSVTVLELAGGAYALRAELAGDDAVDLDLPFAVRLSSDLLDG